MKSRNVLHLMYATEMLKYLFNYVYVSSGFSSGFFMLRGA